MTAGNRIFKYADDTYLLVPSTNSTSRLDEIAHIERWAAENNLQLTVQSQKKSSSKLVVYAESQPNPLQRVSTLSEYPVSMCSGLLSTTD